MALIDYHDVDELKNRNEEKVWMAIEFHLDKNQSLCRCRDCILDAAALALNKIPPRYHVYSFHENAPGDDDETLMAEAKKAVSEAFKQVTKRPHHI